MEPNDELVMDLSWEDMTEIETACDSNLEAIPMSLSEARSELGE